MHYFQTNWKDFTVAYMVPNFEMIRLHLDKQDSLLFSFLLFFFLIFLFGTLHTKYPNSNHISSSVGIKVGLRFN